ncbi:MAG: 50S ribosomal protein L25 [Endomicrobium sp.]|jgi:large subunit ribosomal protein L25|nr:50S ribosomal protein L25 [Endomicrobium sp.]
MKSAVLNVESRVIGSKKTLDILRKKGKIPAVFYGKNVETEPIVVDSKDFTSIINANGINAIIDLNFKNGEKKAAIVKSLQKDILTQNFIHIDFHVISLSDKIEVFVPIHIDGIADGVKNFGGVMEFITREVKILSLPKDIPSKISVNVSELKVGDKISIIDLPKINGVQYVQDSSMLIVHITSVVIEDEKETSSKEVETATQPEVISSKGKKDKESEETTHNSIVKK